MPDSAEHNGEMSGQKRKFPHANGRTERSSKMVGPQLNPCAKIGRDDEGVRETKEV